jgi:hypothetical protein
LFDGCKWYDASKGGNIDLSSLGRTDGTAR